MSDPNLSDLLDGLTEADEPSDAVMGGGRQIVVPSNYVVPDGEFDMIEFIRLLTDGGVLGIMGDSGAGKTKTCLMIAHKVAAYGGKVKYLDTENNLSERNVRGQFTYKYVETLREMTKDAQEVVKQNWDLYIVDSASIFVTARRAVTDMRENGDMQSALHNMFWELNHWSKRTGAAVIVVLQPASTMVSADRKPMLDKGEFFTKNLLDIKYVKDADNNVKRRDLVFFKARDFANNHVISKITIEDAGARLDEEALKKLVARLKQ